MTFREHSSNLAHGDDGLLDPYSPRELASLRVVATVSLVNFDPAAAVARIVVVVSINYSAAVVSSGETAFYFVWLERPSEAPTIFCGRAQREPLPHLKQYLMSAFWSLDIAALKPVRRALRNRQERLL